MQPPGEAKAASWLRQQAMGAVSKEEEGGRCKEGQEEWPPGFMRVSEQLC